jgi:predicted enzyme related to lactoylglutathione lyase
LISPRFSGPHDLIEEAFTMSTASPANPVGKFVWYEWMGEDVQAAITFYGHVVGWNAKDSGMPGMDYTIVSVGDYGVGGMMTIPEEAKAMGASPCWTGYVRVDDVDDAAAKLTAAGGAVKRPGSDIPGVGRFAVVTDPQGAYFILFRDAGGNPQPPAPDTPGLVGWRELHAGDGAKAFDFYANQFGWTKRDAVDMGAMGVYQLFTFVGGDVDYGGMMTRMPQTPGPFWLYYFNVPALDAAVERIKAKCGKILNDPMEVPGGQWIVQAMDPENAMFALIAPKR